MEAEAKAMMEVATGLVGRKRLVEVFSAGCRVCEETIKLIRQIACDSCNVRILDMKEKNVVSLAADLGIRSVPAVVVTSSRLAQCCAAGGRPDEATLRAAGIGQPLELAGRKRVVEVFSAGCHACEAAIELVRKIACRSCDVRILDMKERNVASLAKSVGVHRVPAVLITTSRLAECCAGRGPEASALKAAGIGQRI